MGGGEEDGNVSVTVTQKEEEEDTGAQIAPIVKLEEVAVTTGEEHEDALLDMKAKLYRFDKDGKQWKERGVGTIKFLKHKDSAKVRLVMRQSKTLKICANHLILASMSLQEHAGSDKSWVWHATDFSDGELKEELFCIRLGSVENARKFKVLFEEIAESQTTSPQEGEEAVESVSESQTTSPQGEEAAELVAESQTTRPKEGEEAAELAAERIQSLTVEDEEKVNEETEVEEKAKEESEVEEKKEVKSEVKKENTAEPSSVEVGERA